MGEREKEFEPLRNMQTRRRHFKAAPVDSCPAEEYDAQGHHISTQPCPDCNGARTKRSRKTRTVATWLLMKAEGWWRRGMLVHLGAGSLLVFSLLVSYSEKRQTDDDEDDQL